MNNTGRCSFRSTRIYAPKNEVERFTTSPCSRGSGPSPPRRTFCTSLLYDGRITACSYWRLCGPSWKRVDEPPARHDRRRLSPGHVFRPAGRAAAGRTNGRLRLKRELHRASTTAPKLRIRTTTGPRNDVLCGSGLWPLRDNTRPRFPNVFRK